MLMVENEDFAMWNGAKKQTRREDALTIGKEYEKLLN